jgi:hypothetical protein
MLPMDVLGLLSGLLSHCQSLHWRHGKLWPKERHVCAVPRIRVPTRDRLLLVPDAVLRLHRAARNWWIFRAWSYFAFNDLCFLLGDDSVLPDRMLDLERK